MDFLALGRFIFVLTFLLVRLQKNVVVSVFIFNGHWRSPFRSYGLGRFLVTHFDLLHVICHRLNINKFKWFGLVNWDHTFDLLYRFNKFIGDELYFLFGLSFLVNYLVTLLSVHIITSRAHGKYLHHLPVKISLRENICLRFLGDFLARFLHA